MNTNISLKQTFWLIHDSVSNNKSSKMINLCREMKMEEIPYQSVEKDSDLPDFDVGHWFQYKTENDEICRLEILDKEGEILQSGFQIIMNKLWNFSNLNEHFELIKNRCDAVYSKSLPPDNLIEQKNVTILNYSYKNMVCYLSKMKVNKQHILTFRVGNKKLWNKENKSSTETSVKGNEPGNKTTRKHKISPQIRIFEFEIECGSCGHIYKYATSSGNPSHTWDPIGVKSNCSNCNIENIISENNIKSKSHLIFKRGKP